MDAARWNKMSVSEQILNIGGEVQRAVAKKEKADDEGARKYLQLALDWIELTKADPKNKNRMDEISTAEDELIDYFEKMIGKMTAKQLWVTGIHSFQQSFNIPDKETTA